MVENKFTFPEGVTSRQGGLSKGVPLYNYWDFGNFILSINSFAADIYGFVSIPVLTLRERYLIVVENDMTHS